MRQGVTISATGAIGPRALDAPRRLESIIAVQNDLMASELDLDSVLKLVAAKAERLTCADGAIVEMEDGDVLVYRAATGVAAPHLGVRIATGTSLSGLAIRTSQALLCEDAETDPRVDRETCRRIGLRSMIVVPVRHGGRSVGVLKVMSTTTGRFIPEDVETLQLMAGMMGAAISRAAEYEAKQTLIAERDALIKERESALKAREESARLAEENSAILRMFFESVPFLFGMLERDGDDFRLLAVNPPLAEVFGVSADQAVGQSTVALNGDLGALDAARKPFAEAEATGKPVFWEYTRGEGSRKRFLAASVSLLPGRSDPHRPRFCFVAQDVTEPTLLRARAELNDRMASVGRLAAGVAHEANNPLAYVVSNLGFLNEALKDPAVSMPEETRAEMRMAIAESREGAERVKLIIKDLYTFVRAEDEPMEPVDLASIVKRAVGMCSHLLQPRAFVHLALEPAPSVGSVARLGQVVINLLVNAAQAMPNERPRDQNHVWVRTGVLPNGRSFLEVKDDGVGMTSEVMRRIFEPFFTTKKLGHGMGLGLTICHNIVEAHRGELVVESSPCQGAAFRVLLPSS